MSPSPLLQLLLLAGTLASIPLGWWWLKRRHEQPRARLAALTLLTIFLTFDLIAFGAFTRLTDSGLGCPDWPGCYGQSTPLAAQDHIRKAEAAMPSGPVTWNKAWIEMLHRYLAMVVGALILAIAALSWRHRQALPHALSLPIFTLVWVILQGLFGKYTVTWKLYPAIVSLHLLGAMGLLALLVVQKRAFDGRYWGLSHAQRLASMAVLGLLLVQVALGAWVSTNYAVLACQSFPRCQPNVWWPEADWAQGFTVLRALGHDAQGGYISFSALVAIHLAHRSFALVAAAGMVALGWALHGHACRAVRVHARWLLSLLLLQIATGTANVVLNWPLLGALCHTAGAAALVGVLVSLVAPIPATARLGST
ncbi:MAG: COX15/CtaA family protein [Vitreoscilla sp.]|nr:COX15/CtaA family protein [Vitreoscilla sp.]MBP6674948.1 COX15/CtaA family protein [Vitreoscilla sp.]